MNEKFLHFVWKYRLYSHNLFTSDGLPIEVLHPGQLNTDAGPDFSNARIKIGSTTWAGNVEIHFKTSDWHHHNHQDDDAYSNIILHVVFDNDGEIFYKNHKPVPTLELRGLVNEDVYKKYFYYLNNQNWIPCEKDIVEVDEITWKAWIERLFIERMERKTEQLHILFKHNNNSLTETFYQVLAGNFGFKTNEQPFRMLARVLPANILGKHKNSLFQIEAMMFGSSGLLDQDYRDGYPNELRQEFKFLQSKYALTKIEAHLWKFLRLRPSNFPTIRISQFAALVHKSDNLFSRILEVESMHELGELFDVKASAYWDDHFMFDKTVKPQPKSLGASAADTLILNTVVQFRFFYSIIKGDPKYRDRAINLMLQLKPENNHIIRKWSEQGQNAANAFETQALIELKNNYCLKKKCLNCNIGTKLLRQSASQ